MAFDPITFVLAKAAAGGGGGGGGGGTTGEGMTFKGYVATSADLPAGNFGDMYVVGDLYPDKPGNQAGKAVYSNGKWNYYDEVPIDVSQLANDELYLRSKLSTSGAYLDKIYIDGSGTIPTPTTSANKYLIKDIQFKRGNSAAALATSVPKAGEPVFEYNSTSKMYRLKIGDGVNSYSSLKYIGSDFMPDVDNQSVLMVGSRLAIYGFASAATGKIPRKGNGILEWVSISDFIDMTAGDAITVTKTTDAAGKVTNKIGVKYDNSTVKLNSKGLYVPIDGQTIKSTANGLVASQAKGGQGITATTTAGQTTISHNLKAGANITLIDNADGSTTIVSTGGGGGTGGDKIAAGDGIKVTTNAATGVKTISGDYVAGQYVNINKNLAGKLEISVDNSAITNTVRPIKVNNVDFLDDTPASGAVNFTGKGDETGIELNTVGNKIEMAIANKNIIQISQPSEILQDLNGAAVTLDCGGAAPLW